jgi:hypothetical protein
VNTNKNFFDSVDYRESKNNQKDAVIDMMSLSKTKLIIGSNWSSFSYISSRFNKIPFKIALNKNKISDKISISNTNKVSLICAIKKIEKNNCY